MTTWASCGSSARLRDASPWSRSKRRCQSRSYPHGHGDASRASSRRPARAGATTAGERIPDMVLRRHVCDRAARSPSYSFGSNPGAITPAAKAASCSARRISSVPPRSSFARPTWSKCMWENATLVECVHPQIQRGELLRLRPIEADGAPDAVPLPARRRGEGGGEPPSHSSWPLGCSMT